MIRLTDVTCMLQQFLIFWVKIIQMVIDVTSLLRLWSCRINHNISATRTQPYGTDGRTDRLTNSLALGELEEPFFISSCTVVSGFCSGRK
jgi:hypothetical protein